MDPLLVTGLVSLGNRVIDNILPNSQPTPTSGLNGQSFSQVMAGQSANRPSALGDYLNVERVRDVADFDNLQFRLKQQLLDNPELAHFMSGVDRSSGLQLKLEQGSIFTLSDKNGKQFSFPVDSELGSLAQKIHQLKRMDEMSTLMPQAPMGELARSVERNPVLEASWYLPGL